MKTDSRLHTTTSILLGVLSEIKENKIFPFDNKLREEDLSKFLWNMKTNSRLLSSNLVPLSEISYKREIEESLKNLSDINLLKEEQNQVYSISPKAKQFFSRVYSPRFNESEKEELDFLSRLFLYQFSNPQNTEIYHSEFDGFDGKF